MQRAIDQLLRQPEGRHLEFKRAEADPRKVVRTVCAFANTAVGHVVIGVADDGQVLGVPHAASLEERYASVISDSIEPQLVVDLQRLRVGSQELLIIKVPCASILTSRYLLIASRSHAVDCVVCQVFELVPRLIVCATEGS